MTNQHPTPPPQLVQQWWKESFNHADGQATYPATQAARWADERRLRACIELLDINGCPDRYIDMLRALLPQPQPSLKEQALAKIDAILSDQGRVMRLDEIEVLDLSRRALAQLPDDPAVTPAADDRGPGSVAPDDSPVATDEHIADVFERIAGWRYNYPHTLDALRAVYNLGREHGAANSKPTPNPSQIRSSSPEPAAAPDRPLWVEMRDVYSDPSRIHWSGHGFARELRVVADWLERKAGAVGPSQLIPASWLRAEADRAEASR